MYLPERVLQRLLERAGFGRVMDLEGADNGSVRYLTKYLTKSLGDTPGRVWSWSLNWVEFVAYGAPVGMMQASGWWGRPRQPDPESPWRFAGVERGPP